MQIKTLSFIFNACSLSEYYVNKCVREKAQDSYVYFEKILDL